MPLGRDGDKQDRPATLAGRATPAGGATRAGGANNHGRARGAIAARRALLAAALAVALGGPALAQALPESGDPLVQRNVPAEATAENAVVARDRALAAGQRLAYERMAAQLGLPRGLSDQQIEQMVSSLVIESERVTARSYAARITVSFLPPGGAIAQPGAPPDAPAGAVPSGPAVASVEAVASYRSFPEYVALTRRLAAQPAVARVEVLSMTGEAARLRLALRSQPQAAAAELAQAGLLAEARPGEGWRIGLGGR